MLSLTVELYCTNVSSSEFKKLQKPGTGRGLYTELLDLTL